MHGSRTWSALSDKSYLRDRVWGIPQLCIVIAAIVLPTLALTRVAGGDSSSRPNIVIIFPDDMGYGDLGMQGAKGFQTPNLDWLAREGRRFTDFYVVEPVCSASRAGLLTGCYPVRLGIRGALGPRSEIGISDNEVTLAQLLKSHGYATAIFGKWHLGHHRPFLPLQHGFDEFFGIPYSNDMWPSHPMMAKLRGNGNGNNGGYPNLPLMEGNEIVDAEVTHEDQSRFTTQFTERAVAFIDKHRDQPFFLYVPHPMPHVPLHVSDKFRGKSERGIYGDVIEEIDWSVGRIVEAIGRNGLDDRTLLVFASDNGPWIVYGDHAGSTGGLREAKGTTFEGGVRVPCILRWPGHIPAGTICREPMMTIDLFPTIAAIVGAKIPDHPIDGLDARPLIEGTEGAKCPHEAIFFYYNAGDLEAMRSGRWKLHFPHTYVTLSGRPGGTNGLPATAGRAKTGLELYDLSTDAGELHDVAQSHPDVVEQLTAMADKARRELGDRLTQVEGKGVRPPGRIGVGTSRR